MTGVATDILNIFERNILNLSFMRKQTKLQRCQKCYVSCGSSERPRGELGVACIRIPVTKLINQINNCYFFVLFQPETKRLCYIIPGGGGSAGRRQWRWRRWYLNFRGNIPIDMRELNCRSMSFLIIRVKIKISNDLFCDNIILTIKLRRWRWSGGV